MADRFFVCVALKSLVSFTMLLYFLNFVNRMLKRLQSLMAVSLVAHLPPATAPSLGSTN